MATGKIILGGGIIAALVFVGYNTMQRAGSPSIYFVKSLAGDYNARTIPPFGIYVKESEKENKELLNHELVHWKQYQDGGLFNYYMTYVNQMKQYGYDKMPMEKQARANESDYCKGNYTACVRTGQAKTVHNPNFRTKSKIFA